MSLSDLPNYSLNLTPLGKRPLASSFRPGPFDVICARGKLAHSHEGNKRFRELIKVHQKAYSQAATKYQKSQVVSHITNIVRQSSGEGGFVKLINGIWHEVGDRAAKEKIGQSMRDLLHTKYASSTKAKARIRVQKRGQSESESEDSSVEAASTPGHSPSKNTSSTKEANPNKSSSVSVVSNHSDELDSRPAPKAVPPKSCIGMFIPIDNPTTGGPQGLWDALVEDDDDLFGDELMAPFADLLDPLLAAAPTPKVDTSHVRGASLVLDSDLLDFCDIMGVTCI